MYTCHRSMIVQPGRKIREDRLLISIAFGKEEMGKERKEEGKVQMPRGKKKKEICMAQYQWKI